MNDKMKNLNIKESLLNALRGFADAFERERNLRIHLSAASLISAFAYVYGTDRTGAAVLMLTIALVIFAELVNSAVEKAVDTATDKLRFDAMHAKDYAAAAVLVTAVGAIGVGIALFGDLKRIYAALCTIASDAGLIILFVFILAADLAMLMYPFIKNRILRGKNR